MFLMYLSNSILSMKNISILSTEVQKQNQIEKNILYIYQR